MDKFPRWNKLIDELRDRPDKGDEGSLHAQLDIIKRVENNSDFSEKERLKDGESK